MPSFEESAKCLDNKRLGKQRVECLQILNILKTGPYQCKVCKFNWDYCECSYGNRRIDKNFIKTPWYNHPAVQMWKGYEWALFDYACAICLEWRGRGYKDTIYDKLDLVMTFEKPQDLTIITRKENNTTPWLGNNNFHLSHKSNLIRKFPEHYKKFWPDVPNDLPYWWPTKQT